jgi:hypothetical protein
MPNAARLIAAIGLTLVAFIASGMIMALVPDRTAFGYFTVVNMIIGVLCGWFVMGKRAGRGTTSAINNGFTGMVSLVFWALFVQGTYEMIRLAMRNRYDNAFEALVAIFEIMAKFGTILLDVPLIIFLVAGGVLTGIATEYASRRWR